MSIDGTLALKIPRTILDSGDDVTGKYTDFVIMVDSMAAKHDPSHVKVSSEKLFFTLQGDDKTGFIRQDKLGCRTYDDISFLK